MIGEPAPLLLSGDEAAELSGEAFWVERGGARLRTALFPARGPVRGSVVLSPGRTEPIEKYAEVVGELAARGFVVLAHDWRGQGLSSRLHRDPIRGHARGVGAFVRDYRRVIDAYAARLPRPWIALGHSMGGALTALAIARGESRFAGVVLSAPMFLIQTLDHPPARLRLAAAFMRLTGRAATSPLPPHDFARDVFEGNILTHDRGRWERHRRRVVEHEPLRLGQVTWGWLGFALALAADLARPGVMARVKTPLVAILAQEDRLCVNAAVKTAVARAAQGRWIEIAGASHELLMETDEVRRQFWTEFDALARRVAPAA